jgi:hypothetical protein
VLYALHRRTCIELGATRVVTERTAKALQYTVLGKVLPRAGRVRGDTNAIGHLHKRIVKQIRDVVKLPRPAFLRNACGAGYSASPLSIRPCF